MKNITLKHAEKSDAAIILDFIKELAEYEHLSDEVVATEEILTEWIFEKGRAEVIIAEADNEPAGFVLFFHSFSTFLGRAGIYIEDLFVKGKYRGLGIGKRLIAHVAHLTLQRGCGRLEWACLDWNQPSIGFYLSLKAQPQSEWTTYRLTGDSLISLAKQDV